MRSLSGEDGKRGDRSRGHGPSPPSLGWRTTAEEIKPKELDWKCCAGKAAPRCKAYCSAPPGAGRRDVRSAAGAFEPLKLRASFTKRPGYPSVARDNLHAWNRKFLRLFRHG